MKQLNRNFRNAGLMAAVLMAAAGADTTATAAPAAAPKPPTKKELAAQAAVVKAAEKAKKLEEAKAAAEAKATKDEQNGVTRPASGKTLQVWTKADEMSAALKAPVDRKTLTDALLDEGLVVGTIHTQYGKWRKYHGLVTVKAEKPATDETPAGADAEQTEEVVGDEAAE